MGVIIKLDFEKAYDEVKLSFLQQTLRMKGFFSRVHALINDFVSGGSVTLAATSRLGKVSDRATHYYPCYLNSARN
jgi:hypothetical protein